MLHRKSEVYQSRCRRRRGTCAPPCGSDRQRHEDIHQSELRSFGVLVTTTQKKEEPRVIPIGIMRVLSALLLAAYGPYPKTPEECQNGGSNLTAAKGMKR